MCLKPFLGATWKVASTFPIFFPTAIHQRWPLTAKASFWFAKW